MELRNTALTARNRPSLAALAGLWEGLGLGEVVGWILKTW